MVSSTFSRPF